MAVEVLEIPGVAAPEGILCGLRYLCARFLCLLHHHINFVFAVYIVADGELGGAGRSKSDGRVVGDVTPRPDRKLQAIL